MAGINSLRMSVGVIYLEYVDSVECVSGIRELLLDNTKDPWVTLTGGGEWVKLAHVGTIFRNTRHGTPFEARRYGPAGDSEFEIFHICRTGDCRFLASNNKVPEYLGTDGRARETHHVARFAFTEKTAPVVPGVDVPGPALVVKAFKAPEKLISGLVVTGLLFLVRLKQVLASVDVAKSVSDATTYLMHGVIGSFMYGVCAFESGLIGGVAKFYWDDHPHWALWATRGLLYGGVVWFFDGHIWAYHYARSRSSQSPVTTPVTITRRRSGISDNGSDYDDCSCTANSLYMALPSKLTALSQRPCKDNDCEIAQILREDHAASKLPQVFLTEGLPLRSTHRDIYNTLRGNQACATLQRMRLGGLRTRWKELLPDSYESSSFAS